MLVMMVFETVIRRVEEGVTLGGDEAAEVMGCVADGGVSTGDIVRFLEAYNRRVPSVEELTAFVRVLRERAVRVAAPAGNTICNCGTGGDGRGTVNVSTMAAFVIAACGIPVAKHGNRSVSSRCGSTDCLSRLGVRASRSAAEAGGLLSETGLCFMNAPDFHPAMRQVADARRELARRGCKTIFNLLGPMLNPAGVRRQCMGVFDESLVEPVGEVLLRTGTERAYVMHGDGYDEITLTGPTRVAMIADGGVTTRVLTPEEMGLRRCDAASLQGGDAEANARVAEGVLGGGVDGPVAEMVVVNAAAGISAGSNDNEDIVDAIAMAREALVSGRAYEMLRTMRRKAPADA